MSINLYEVNELIDELTESLIDFETGEIDEAVLEQIENLEMEKEQVIENLSLKVKNIRAFVDALTNEKKSIESRIKTSTNRADRIENYIANALQGKPFSTSKCQISWRRSERVEIVNEESIPEEYMKYQTTSKPDKTLIKDALKNDKQVPGAMLVEKNNMSIK